jgi:chemotaxis protein histidine kinase CheA
MSASPEELLRDYASESSEHISELESLLLGAERECPSPEAISAILRCFHSLKGLSRVMGSSALEKVAHSAETVMSSVRSGQLIFEGDVLEVLLRVLDTIRGLRAELIMPAKARNLSPSWNHCYSGRRGNARPPRPSCTTCAKANSRAA